MKVTKKLMPDGYYSWTVFDQSVAVPSIDHYLDFLYHLQKSPNTLRAYAYHLMHYWQYLASKQLAWMEVKLEHLAGFITWLRLPAPNVIVIHTMASKRTENSINAALAAVTSFYKFHEQIGGIAALDLYQTQLAIHQKYKPFLHHLNSTSQRQARILTVKIPQRIPMTLTPAEVKHLLDLCYCRRDKFLIYLLYETGIRIGQALGLFHEDIRSFDNEIHIVPREHHVNQARAKTYQANCLPVSQALMHRYADYVTKELAEDNLSPYVFIVLKGAHKGQPLRYTAMQDLFQRFSQTLGRKITPHMLRHTHATELIHSGWDMAFVRKRLGHKSIQTTVNTYVHLTTEEMKAAFKRYQEHQDENHSRRDITSEESNE